MKNLNLETRVMGRTSKVVSPLFDDLLAGWFGVQNHQISSSNAGEQGMTIKAATTLRFSSSFSVETFQLIDLLFHAVTEQDQPGEVIFQQYLSQSPHFHEKKGDRHIRKMIEESLGCFFSFEKMLPDNVKARLQQVYADLQLERVEPIVYPALQDLPLDQFAGLIEAYALFPRDTSPNLPVVEVNPSDLMTTDIPYRQLLLADVSRQDLIIADTNSRGLLSLDVTSPELLLADTNRQDMLTGDILMAD
jgi:hypothetical protein